MMDFFGVPVTSMVMLLLAGILIGHCIWYQDRSRDSEKIAWLEKRYFQSRKVAQHRKHYQNELRRMRDEQQFQLGSLRKDHEATLVQLETSQRTVNSIHEQLELVRGEQRETIQQLADERHRNEMLVAQLQEFLQAKTRLENRPNLSKTIANANHTATTSTRDQHENGLPSDARATNGDPTDDRSPEQRAA